MAFAEGVPTTTVMLGGVAYELGWTWAAKRRVRDSLTSRGKHPLSANEEEHLATALWAAMDKEQRESITLEQVEELIHPGNEESIANSMKTLIGVSEPEESEGNGNPAAEESPTAGASVSRTVGQSASTTSG